MWKKEDSNNSRKLSMQGGKINFTNVGNRNLTSGELGFVALFLAAGLITFGLELKLNQILKHGKISYSKSQRYTPRNQRLRVGGIRDT
jgi:hypothetical protein